MLLGVESDFFRGARKGEKSATLLSVAVGALDRHDLVMLGFAERDYFDVRDWV